MHALDELGFGALGHIHERQAEPADVQPGEVHRGLYGDGVGLNEELVEEVREMCIRDS